MSAAQSGFPIGQHGTGKGGVVTGQPLTGPPGTDYHYVTSTILRQKNAFAHLQICTFTNLHIYKFAPKSIALNIFYVGK